VEGHDTTACAGELGAVKQDKVAIEKANPAHGITHDHQLLRAHGGRHKLTVQVDAVFDVVIGRAWKLAVSHAGEADPSG
jgi:hypothetical protein